MLGMRELLTKLMDRQVVKDSSRAVKYVHVGSAAQAKELVADVYWQLTEDFQIVSPFVLHTPAPLLLAAAWMMVRETLIVGKVSRASKEAISVGVSKANACPYCVSVHAAMMNGAGETEVAEALLAGAQLKSTPSETARLGLWGTRTLLPDDELLRDKPYSPTVAAEIIGTAVAFHYINRMVNVFLDESPMPKFLRPFGKLTRKLLGVTLGRRMVVGTPAPGRALAFLPEVPLPPDFRWAESNPSVAGAFARASAAIEDAGARVLPAAVRQLISKRISEWQGQSPGLGRAWVERDIQSLTTADQPLARFTLLVALAPYQIDSSIIDSFRGSRPTDEQLVSAASWGAFTAARRVGTWL